MSQYSSAKKKKNSSLLIFGVVFSILLLWLLFSPNGLITYWRVHKELTIVRNENKKLKEENAALAEEIDRLQNDNEYIEELARKKYGMIKKNEIIFDFSKK